MVSRDIADDVDRVTAKLIAVEAVVVQILTPLLEAIQPGLAAEVTHTIRVGLNVADGERISAARS